jgi:glucan phosphoethanolaminetransferase (alkaline phosphatase superfamily)
VDDDRSVTDLIVSNVLITIPTVIVCTVFSALWAEMTIRYLRFQPENGTIQMLRGTGADDLHQYIRLGGVLMGFLSGFLIAQAVFIHSLFFQSRIIVSRFRLHLSTLIIIVIGSGLLLWFNLIRIPLYADSDVYKMGWPIPIYVYNVDATEPPYWYWFNAFVNFVFWLAMLGAVAAWVEFLINRKNVRTEARKFTPG